MAPANASPNDRPNEPHAEFTPAASLTRSSVIGESVFAHEADVREGGVFENPMAYEIMTPEMVGARRSRLVLGSTSGREAMLHRLSELGYELDPGQVDQAYEQFRMLA